MQGNSARQHFSNLSRLLREGGLIGQALSRYPDLVQEAGRWAEWQFDRQTRCQDPDRLPLPDPWQFLLAAPAVAASDKAVFRAAQRQLHAVKRFAAMARGEATLNADWNERLMSARTARDVRHALDKIAAVRARYALFRAQSHENSDPQYREWVAQQVEQSRRERVKRGEKFRATRSEPVPRMADVRDKLKLSSRLIEWWVVGPCGAPGLMFFRNAARTDFLKVWVPQSNLSPETVKKDCQRLGLIPVGKVNHFVWEYRAMRGENGEWKSIGFQRNQQLAFSAKLKGLPG